MAFSLALLFLVAAFVVFVIAGIFEEPPRSRLIAIGLALMTLAFIFSSGSK